MKQDQEVKVTQEEAEDAVAAISTGEAVTTSSVFRFSSKELLAFSNPITLAPLSIFYSKKVATSLQGLTDLFQQAAKEDQKKRKDKAIELLDNIDSKVVQGLMNACKIILECYKIAVTDSELEEHASLGEVVSFVQMQYDINGGNDFLLQPLQIILGIITTSQQEVTRSLNSLASSLGQSGSDKP